MSTPRDAFSLLCLTALLLGTAGTAMAADMADDFSIITRKNIFLRDRRPPPDPANARHPADAPSQPREPDPPAKSIVLRGVVIEGGELHAYVEDTRSGDVSRLIPGDAIAGGHVSNIEIDALAFEQEGQVQWVDVGQNLFGDTVAAPPPTTAPAAGGNSAAKPIDPAISAMEQRMRERRTRNQRTSK